eukprot:Nk52_evm65s78 gene=Nk52_evmTU65s78
MAPVRRSIRAKAQASNPVLGAIQVSSSATKREKQAVVGKGSKSKLSLKKKDGGKASNKKQSESAENSNQKMKDEAEVVEKEDHVMETNTVPQFEDKENLKTFDPAAPAEGLSEYEKQRLENISRNLEMMESLGLSGSSMGTLVERATSIEKPEKKIRVKQSTTAAKKVRKAKVIAPRTSRRLRGLDSAKPEGLSTFDDDPDSKKGKKTEAEDDVQEYDPNVLIPMEEFFKDKYKTALKTDGFFKGWVNPVLISKYGLEESAAAAWEKHGGGKFSYKNPGGGKSKGASQSSNAKMFAKKMFRKNPNCYFYRNLEPGIKQEMGLWSEEEHNLFLETVKKFGCGNKWGLFSSYIPNRVGYQCSAYYRHVIIREGLVMDPNFKMTPEGTPIYTGKRFQSNRD